MYIFKKYLFRAHCLCQATVREILPNSLGTTCFCRLIFGSPFKFLSVMIANVI